METKDQLLVDDTGDFTTSSVPAELRKSNSNIFFTVAGWVICLSTLLTGGSLAAGLDFPQAMYATIIGMILLTVIAAPLAALGAYYGVSTVMLSRAVFGELGAKLFGFLVVISNGVVWYAFQAAFFALTMQELFPTSIFSNLMFGAGLGGFFMAVTAMYGYRGIAILSFFAVPMIVIVSFFGSVAAVEQAGGFAQVLKAGATADPITLATGVSLVVGNAVIGSVILADISRYAKSPKAGATSASFGYMIGCIFTIAAGLTMAYVTSIEAVGTTPNLPAVMVKVGLGFGALLILVLAQWTTNTANLYSASLGVGAFINIPQKYSVALLGTLATSLAMFDVYTYFVPVLLKMSTVIPPIGGIIIADYLLVSRLKKHDFSVDANFFTFNWLALAIVIISAYVAQTFFTFFAPAFTALAIGFCSYALLANLFDRLQISYRVSWGDHKASTGISKV